jgi:glycosyltransferase involved in cell wall biosynthesis
MSFPRVTILCPEVGSNALGRSLLLARLLPPETRPEVLGLTTRDAIWAPARSQGIPVESFRVDRVRGLGAARRWLRERVRGDVLIASKPLPTSLGLALASGLGRVRIALDIDDWEMGLALPHDGSNPSRLWRAGAAFYGALRRGQPNSLLGTWLCQSLARRVPSRLVSNRWLEHRFGGTLLYHVRDDREFDPARVRGEALRAELALDGRPWVGFVGTVRVHKGVKDLIAALGLLRGPDAPGLLLFGLNREDPVARDVERTAREVLGPARLRVRGPFPIENLAAHVDAADIAAIPSRDMAGSRGQLPAKLFDAMTLGKPVVATALSDVPEILDGCGITVPPGDPHALAGAIDRFRDPGLRRAYGCAARRRVLTRYSFRAARQILGGFVERAAS